MVACLALTGLFGVTATAGAAKSEFRVSGGGILSNGDQFGGTAADTSGHWIHATPTGARLHGTVTHTGCSIDPFDNQCAIDGTGTFDGEAALFHITVSDRGEGRALFPDDYAIVIGRASDLAILHEANAVVVHGNIQVRGAN